MLLLLVLGMPHAVAAAAKPLDDTTAGTSGCQYGKITADADGPPPCHPQARPNPYVDSPAVSIVIQTFKDGALNAMQLVQRLRPIPLPKDIIVNDDSHGGQSGIWLKLLTGANEFYISSPNLHETRAYNRLSHYARGELLVFVQGDCCLPSSPQWMMDAAQLFRSLPSLAMLSARAGFDTVLTPEMTDNERNAHTQGAAPYAAIDYTARIAEDGSKSIPFNFAPGVDNGPLFYRREALLKVGGFDETYSCKAGHVAIHYDFEVALRFWLSGWQVGVYYGASSNGLGGRKSMRKLPMRQERHINEGWNVRRIQRLLRKHNATISSKLRASTLAHLTPIPAQEREGVRERRELMLGKLPSDERCFEGINLNTSTGAASAGGKTAPKKLAGRRRTGGGSRAQNFRRRRTSTSS
jgi:GT2 family glycosyltransferase